MWGEDTGFFVLEDAWVGMAVRAGFRSRGSAPSAALGALRTEPPLRVTASAASWSRYAGFFVPEDALGCTAWDGGTRRFPLAGECPLCGAPTTIDTGALRTEPPLRVTGRDARMSSTHDICHVQVMTLCTAAARKPAV